MLAIPWRLPRWTSSREVRGDGAESHAPTGVCEDLSRPVALTLGALAPRHRLSLVPPPSSTAAPPSSGDEPPALPKSTSTALPWPGLDRLGFTQAIGGLALGLIALFSSYDHLSIAGLNIALPQQWGIPLIALSVAIIFVGCVGYSAPLGRDAQLATRSRLRAADERKSDRDRAEQRENEADRERNRAAEARERQAESLERIRQAVVLSARVQLDPSDTNRARLQTFLTLLSQSAPEDPNL